MTTIYWLIGIYAFLGIIASIIICRKESMFLESPLFVLIIFLIWPYVFWAIVLNEDNTGRWI